MSWWDPDREDDRTYTVVVNEKGEWSIWLDYKQIPAGWKAIGVVGKKDHCLDFIERKCVFGDPESHLKD